METKITPVWMKAVIISLISIVYGLVLHFMGESTNQALGMVQYVILMGGIIYFCIQYAKQKNGDVTFGNVFGHGFKVVAAVAVIIILWSIISIKLIFPEMIDTILQKTRESLDQNNNMSDTDKENAVEMTRKFFIPFMIAGMILFYAIVGAISAAIGAGVARKNPNPNPL